ncbi:aspartate aminotransferase family protein [Candidatus Poriferisodalis sp.]|uniref:aspartate aminotransferase family protein n=1 Tax=Candidatus Poriferisodalis sp. TaxID=3101277 RepID=UPI003B5BAFF4
MSQAHPPPGGNSAPRQAHDAEHVGDLSRTAARHLWSHFSSPAAVPIIERGDGCYLWDDAGHRLLDGLAGLFVTQVGHGRTELAEAAREQMSRLAYFPMWGYGHPAGVKLAARLADLAPGDLNRVYFTSGGSEAIESAWKLARQYFAAIGQPTRYKVISRNLAYHGTSLGALSITGLAAIRMAFEPLVPGAIKVAHTDEYRVGGSCGHDGDCLCAAEEIEQAVLREGPDTVAAVFLEPVQNSGGCYVPTDGYFERVREICDEHGVLLVSDDVICGFGRLGHMFGAQRFGYQPDMITMAKGLTSGYAPLGGVMISDRIAEPFLADGKEFIHGFTFGGHPVAAAVALANIDILEREDLPGRVRMHADAFRVGLSDLCDVPIVTDLRGDGYFLALELDAGGPSEPAKAQAHAVTVCKYLTKRLYELGMTCRAAARGEVPVIQFSPPLIAGPEQFGEITSALRVTLGDAMAEFDL